MYEEAGDEKSRRLPGMLLRELSRNAPEAFSAHAAQVGKQSIVFDLSFNLIHDTYKQTGVHALKL